MPFDASRESVVLLHGSQTVVERPVYGVGNPHNDYGLAFYCTEVRDLAREWACPTAADGFVNEYRFDLSGLRVVDLESPDVGPLGWLAVLVANRRFRATTPLMAQAKEFVLGRYLPDVSGADVVCGYRADDSYFAFARAFLDGRIALAQLERALVLGGLGTQVAVVSPHAFRRLSFAGAERVDGSFWNPLRMERDRKARSAYAELAAQPVDVTQGTYVLDLMRRG